MSSVFTDHVTSLTAKTDTEMAPLGEIKGVLRSELRRRGIFEYGPSLLGYLGSSWNDAEAMDDLAHDCYVRAILTRLRGLLSNLEITGDIEKLVRRNIRAFVGERQKQFDPVGYAVFQNIKAAVLELAETGKILRLDTESGPITGESRFATVAGRDVHLAAEATLKEAVMQADSILDGLDELSRIGVMAQERLIQLLSGFAEQGIGAFSVASLKRCLWGLIAESAGQGKNVRTMRLADLHDNFLESIRTTVPDVGYEEGEHLRKVVSDISSAIEALSRSKAVKTRLTQLLTVLAASAVEEERPQTLDELAAEFGVARSTVHDDVQCLRVLVRRWHGSADSKT